MPLFLCFHDDVSSSIFLATTNVLPLPGHDFKTVFPFEVIACICNGVGFLIDI